MSELIFGAFLGGLLVVAKMGLFYLITGGEEQWCLPFMKQGIRDWCYGGPVRRGGVDILVGVMGAKALSMFGENMVAGVAMATYTITCMGVLFFPIFTKKLKRRLYCLREVLPF